MRLDGPMGVSLSFQYLSIAYLSQHTSSMTATICLRINKKGDNATYCMGSMKTVHIARSPRHVSVYCMNAYRAIVVCGGERLTFSFFSLQATQHIHPHPKLCILATVFDAVHTQSLLLSHNVIICHSSTVAVECGFNF